MLGQGQGLHRINLLVDDLDLLLLLVLQFLVQFGPIPSSNLTSLTHATSGKLVGHA